MPHVQIISVQSSFRVAAAAAAVVADALGYFCTCSARTPIATLRGAPSSTIDSDAVVPDGTGAVIASHSQQLVGYRTIHQTPDFGGCDGLGVPRILKALLIRA